MRAVLIGIGIMVILFGGYRLLAYNECTSKCNENCDGQARALSIVPGGRNELMGALCEKGVQNCKSECRLF
jgi:hypothetical protein